MDLTDETLEQVISSHYITALKAQIGGIVLGGADLLGNPINFVNAVGRGIRQADYEPSRGVVLSPMAMREDSLKVLKGGVGIIGSVVQGSLGVVTTIGSTTTRALATLSFDKEYLAERESSNLAGLTYEGIG